MFWLKVCLLHSATHSSNTYRYFFNVSLKKNSVNLSPSACTVCIPITYTAHNTAGTAAPSTGSGSHLACINEVNMSCFFMLFHLSSMEWPKAKYTAYNSISLISDEPITCIVPLCYFLLIPLNSWRFFLNTFFVVFGFFPRMHQRHPSLSRVVNQRSPLMASLLPSPKERSPHLFLGGRAGRHSPEPAELCDTKALTEELNQQLASVRWRHTPQNTSHNAQPCKDDVVGQWFIVAEWVQQLKMSHFSCNTCSWLVWYTGPDSNGTKIFMKCIKESIVRITTHISSLQALISQPFA